jgi:hypothetical protein
LLLRWLFDLLIRLLKNLLIKLIVEAFHLGVEVNIIDLSVVIAAHQFVHVITLEFHVLHLISNVLQFIHIDLAEHRLLLLNCILHDGSHLHCIFDVVFGEGELIEGVLMAHVLFQLLFIHLLLLQ